MGWWSASKCVSEPDCHLLLSILVEKRLDRGVSVRVFADRQRGRVVSVVAGGRPDIRLGRVEQAGRRGAKGRKEV